MDTRERDGIITKDFALVLEKVIKAVSRYKMIIKKDKILVAVSGGKDSLSMMHLLDYLCKNKIFDFQMLVVNIDLGYGCANRYVLKEHFEAFSIPYFFIDRDIFRGKSRKDIGCFWCSWNRRKALFEAAKEYGCNKISLGHHLDDIACTTLMNIIFHGEISTSPPYLKFFDGELALIRPLCYVEEEETERLAKVLSFPLPCCACPRKPTSKRTLVKNIFSPVFNEYPQARENIYKALRSLLSGKM